MRVIGLTGGIGSGKSTIAEYLTELGAKVIDADKVANEVYNPGTEGWKDVVEAFGEEILSSTDEIDRKKLGEIVFNNPQALSKLNKIIHPRAYELVKSRLEEYHEQGVEAVVLEVILLFEAGWDHLADVVWVTVASEDTVVNRLTKERGLSEEEILARIRSQTPSEERIKHADEVIYNDGGIDKLKVKVKELWDKNTG